MRAVVTPTTRARPCGKHRPDTAWFQPVYASLVDDHSAWPGCKDAAGVLLPPVQRATERVYEHRQGGIDAHRRDLIVVKLEPRLLTAAAGARDLAERCVVAKVAGAVVVDDSVQVIHLVALHDAARLGGQALELEARERERDVGAELDPAVGTVRDRGRGALEAVDVDDQALGEAVDAHRLCRGRLFATARALEDGALEALLRGKRLEAVLQLVELSRREDAR